MGNNLNDLKTLFSINIRICLDVRSGQCLSLIIRQGEFSIQAQTIDDVVGIIAICQNRTEIRSGKVNLHRQLCIIYEIGNLRKCRIDLAACKCSLQACRCIRKNSFNLAQNRSRNIFGVQVLVRIFQCGDIIGVYLLGICTAHINTGNCRERFHEQGIAIGNTGLHFILDICKICKVHRLDFLNDFSRVVTGFIGDGTLNACLHNAQRSIGLAINIGTESQSRNFHTGSILDGGGVVDGLGVLILAKAQLNGSSTAQTEGGPIKIDNFINASAVFECHIIALALDQIDELFTDHIADIVNVQGNDIGLIRITGHRALQVACLNDCINQLCTELRDLLQHFAQKGLCFVGRNGLIHLTQVQGSGFDLGIPIGNARLDRQYGIHTEIGDINRDIEHPSLVHRFHCFCCIDDAQRRQCLTDSKNRTGHGCNATLEKGLFHSNLSFDNSILYTYALGT